MPYEMLSVVFWIVILGAVFYYTVVKKNANRKAAESGEDKESVKNAVRAVMNGAEDYGVVYAHWEERESYGRSVRITYHRFAVAFRDKVLYVFPLGIDKKTRQMGVAQPKIYTPENLGKVTLNVKEKNGVATGGGLTLRNKEGDVLMELTMDVENLRKSKYFPVNLSQQEEFEAFQRFLTPLAQQVERENPGVDAAIAATNNEGLGILGAGACVMGTIIGIFFAPVGIVMCLVGLIMSIVSKVKGAPGKMSLIVSAVCMVISVFLLWMFMKYF